MFRLNGVPSASSDNAVLKRFVIREPISIFSQRKHVKDEEEKEKFNQLLKGLRMKLPEDFYIGAAVGEGDSFFDSVAQGLNELQDKGLITDSNRFSIKCLRVYCKQYAQQVNQSKKDSWLDSALKREGRKLRKYIRNIEFTAGDIENTSSGSKIKIISGKPEIEGKMVCEKYGIKVKIIEVRDEEIEGFVTKSKLGTGNAIIYIVNYRNHFVPLLSNIEKDIKKSINVSREEVYGNVIGSKSNNISQSSCVSTQLQGIENSSPKQRGHSKCPNKENRKMGRKRRCSICEKDNKAPKRAHIDVNINNEDTEFSSDIQSGSRQDEFHKKWKCSITDKDNKAPKGVHAIITSNDDLEFSNDIQYESRQDELDNSYQTNQYIPHQLIRLMYQLDLSVLCSLRESIYKYKYSSLSLAFGDSEVDKFGDITLRYKEKSIHFKIESVDKYYTDNDINYARLFNKEKEKRSFFMNNYFDSFVKHLLSRSDSLSNNVEYLIIYTNSGLDFTVEMKLKQSRSRSFYPFEFVSMNIEDCGILKDFLCTNNNITGRGFYQFSQNKATREELLKRLEFSSLTQKEIKRRKFSPEFEKEIKEAFLDKLVFAVNQPSREELNGIVKNEISIKVKDNYVELQEKILCDLTTQKVHKKHGNDISEIMYSFSLLMSFLHDMCLNKNMFSINLKGKGCDISNGIAINYKERTTYIKALNADSNIGYSHLFPSRTQERKNKFSINKHFTLFIEELKKDKNIRYYIIYTNAGLDLTEEKKFEKVPSKDFYPLKLNSIDFQKKKYKILRHCLCVDKNGLYQFSQEEITILSSLLKLPPFLQSKRQERLTHENEKEIKKKFLSKLIFAVNQPNREEMNSIIKNEIENKYYKVPYNHEELYEIALRWSESHEFGPITKGRIEKLLKDIKSNTSSYQGIQNENMDEEIKRFAKSVVGREGTSAFNQFLDFLIKGGGIKYLEILKRQRINLPNMSSILNKAGKNATKAFNDLCDLWFDTKGNKTSYLKTLENEGVNLPNMSSILRGAGKNATKAFKDLYGLWFDAKGSKTQYLKTLENKGVNLPNLSSILNGAGINAAKAFKDLYDLWFDAKGNKTQYLKTLEDEGINLANMSSILHGAGSKAAEAFKDLYDLWFDARGNKTPYVKTLEDKGLNLLNMSSVLNGAGNNAAKAFKDLYDLWFDTKGNRTQYLKSLEDEGVNLPNMSSILSGAGASAAHAFKELYDLWFDTKINDTQYLKTLKDEEVNVPSMSSILHGAGSKAAKAFKDLYDLWFDAKGNKTQYIKTIENEGVNLPNMSSILRGSGANATKSFKDLYYLWFDTKGNKTVYLKTLEDKGVNLYNMSSILHGAGSKAAEAFKDLYFLWFDTNGNKTQYLKTLEDEGVNLSNMSSILSRAGFNGAKAFKDLYDMLFDARGNKTKYLKTLEDEGLNVPNMSSILSRAGVNGAKAFKDLYDLWFDAKGNKTQYLKCLEEEGVNLLNMSSILSGAGANASKAFKELFNLINKETYTAFKGLY
ncbi:hypothetical protein AVEN_63870-1 [Araneus ventricosus]|uniref:Uncharacterized protein n=1 Tax=Araneus ventricosus TaxID=182803 RepID=A0A4Y2M4I8_ARAVE|nr:hypothetical protein AVEN_63870-1 [Araneus ventricosus]